jgi:SEC-C motif-containing protein
MATCPCGSGQPFADCCKPFITGLQRPDTAEELMRARYSAYATSAVDFIHDTTHPSQRKHYNQDSVARWSKDSTWLGLDILRTEKGGPEDSDGVVEFIAHYSEKEKPVDHHEIAEFVKTDGQWFFLDGKPPKQTQVVRQGPKTGRNEPCPCGSGKKYKKCCG